MDKSSFKYAWHIVRKYHNMMSCDYTQLIGYLAQSGADWQTVYAELDPRAYYVARKCYIVGKNPNPTRRQYRRRKRKLQVLQQNNLGFNPDILEVSL